MENKDKRPERIGPTEEQKNKAEYETVNPARLGNSDEQNSVETVRNVAQTHVQKYWRKRYITDRQFAAAEKLWQHYFHSGLSPSLTSRYEDAPTAGINTYGMPASEKQAAHRREYREAMNQIGFLCSDYLKSIVIEDISAPEAALRRGQPKRSAAPIGFSNLREALEALANHWNIGDNYKSEGT